MENLNLVLTYLEACVILKQVDKVKDRMDSRIIQRVVSELDSYVMSIREEIGDN